MWKTLYDMCTGSPDEQQLYHSISTVATLLLQIGEVGKQYKSRPSSSDFPSPETGPPTDAGEMTLPGHSTEISRDNNIASFDNVERQSSPSDDCFVGGPGTSMALGDCKTTSNLSGAQAATVGGSSEMNNSDAVKSKTAGDSNVHVGELTPVDNDPLSDLLAEDGTDSECEDIIRQLEECHQGKSTDSEARAGNAGDEPDALNRSWQESKPDPDWSIKFEQFLASMLTEPHLVAVFEKDTDIISIVERYRQRRLRPSIDDDFTDSMGAMPHGKRH